MESAVSRYGPNSWKRPKVDGAPGPPLYLLKASTVGETHTRGTTGCEESRKDCLIRMRWHPFG
eukprot:6202352-Pleurochrysis_carterae.AAC.3